jgi:protein TonB
MTGAGSEAIGRREGGGDAVLARFERIAAEEARRRRQLGAAIGAALAAHAIALVLRLPEVRGEPELAAPRVIAKLYPTPQFARQPQAPPAPKKRTRPVPVPDPTPAEPEPLRAETPPAPEPQAYALVEGDVLPPRKIYAPQPPYPDVAKRVRREGTVVLELLIERDGTISSIRPTTEIGFGLEESAVRTVSQWKLEPALLRGKPVPVLYRLHVRFELDWASAG